VGFLEGLIDDLEAGLESFRETAGVVKE